MEGSRVLGADVTGGYELLCGFWEPNPDSILEQPGLLTDKHLSPSSLQWLFFGYFVKTIRKLTNSEFQDFLD